MKISIRLMVILAILLFAVPNYAAAVEVEDLKALCTEKKSGDQCFALGEYYRTVDMNNKSAIEYLVLGCNLDNMTSCVHAGILLQQSGTMGSGEWKQAADLFQKACDQHHDKGCYNLGTSKFKEGRAKKAMELYQLACEYGNQMGCNKVKSLTK